MKNLILLTIMILTFNAYSKENSICPAGTTELNKILVVYIPKSDVSGSYGHIQAHFKTLMSKFKENNIRHAVGFIRKTESSEHQFTLYVSSPDGGNASREDAQKLVAMDDNVKKKLFKIKVQDWVNCIN